MEGLVVQWVHVQDTHSLRIITQSRQFYITSETGAIVRYVTLWTVGDRVNTAKATLFILSIYHLVAYLEFSRGELRVRNFFYSILCIILHVKLQKKLTPDGPPSKYASDNNYNIGIL